MKKVYIEPEIFSIVLDKEIMDVIPPTNTEITDPDSNKSQIFDNESSSNSPIWDTDEGE